MSETKSEKFLRIGAPRFERAYNAMKLMENLGGRDYEIVALTGGAWVDNLIHRAVKVALAFGMESRVVSAAKRAGLDIAPTAPPPVTREAATANREAEPVGARRPVSGVDRRDIRDALGQLQRGDTETGIKNLRKIVLGWPPEAWEEAV